MVKKTTMAKSNAKTEQFAVASKSAAVLARENRPCWVVRALRWIFITAPRAIWDWICSIEIGGLLNLAMLLLIIILFSILLGQVLGMRCDRVIARPIPEITIPVASEKDNVKIISEPIRAIKNDKITANDKIIIPVTQKTIVLPLKKNTESVKVAQPTFVKIDGDVIVDGAKIGRRLPDGAKINGNLYLQNMRFYTLPCNVKINGDLIVRNVRQLRFCECFTVNGNIYVSSDSSFGPIPRTAKIRGSVIF
jgi:hypothetical protein